MRFTALALALALALAGCGDEPEEPDPTFVSVCDALAGEVPDGKVSIEGQAVPLNDLGGVLRPGSLGLVLTGDECSIFVTTPGREAVALERGERLTAHGVVRPLGDVEAERIRLHLDRSAGATEVRDGLPGAVPIAPGDPFVDGFSLTGAGSGS